MAGIVERYTQELAKLKAAAVDGEGNNAKQFVEKYIPLDQSEVTQRSTRFG